MRSNVPSRRMAPLMLAAAASLGVLVGAPAAAATAAVFRITFTGCSLEGQGPANETIRIIHRDAAGATLRWVARPWCASRKGDVIYRMSIVP